MSYLSAENIPTNTDTEGNWKAVYSQSANGLKVRMKGGMDITLEIPALTIIPIAFNKVYNTGTDITNGHLTGLN